MVHWMLCLFAFAVLGGQADAPQKIPGQAECTAVYFTSPHCEPCQQMLPALTQLRQDGWDVRAVNAPENTELAATYRIDSIPTVVIVATKASKEIDRVVGLVTYEQLDDRLRRAAARFSPTPVAGNGGSATAASSGSMVVRGQAASLANGFPLLANGVTSMSMASAATPSHAPPGSNDRVPAKVASRTHESLPNAGPGVSSSSPEKPALTTPQAIARAEAATVRIRVDESNTTAYGTGTVIHVHGNQALVLTCGHLFRDMTPGSRLSVDLFAGKPQEMNVSAELIDFRAEEEDIGLISFVMPVRIEPVDVFPADQKLSVGQVAFSFGCDHGQPPSRRDTQVRHINRFLGPANVEIVGAPAVGRSGGGLFDLQGRLLGVCNAADAESDEGIYAAAEVIYDQLNRLGLNQLFAPHGLATPNTATNPHQLASARLGPNASSNAFGNQSLAAPPTASGPNSLETPAGYAGRQQDTSSGRAAGNDLLWPDERPDAARIQASLAAAAGSSQISPTGELICIFRDAQGQSRVVTIARPSVELLNMIEQQPR
jgi:thiol-disulfide isomerase/thioredoxin